MKYENSAKRVILLIVAALAVLSVQTEANEKKFLKQSVDILDDKPIVIGILSQPKSSKNLKDFPTDQYILEINREFIESSGMIRAMPIHYDTPENVLNGILDKIDGVHFTGGGLDIFNFTTMQWHPYY